MRGFEFRRNRTASPHKKDEPNSPSPFYATVNEYRRLRSAIVDCFVYISHINMLGPLVSINTVFGEG
jgi:hypothetical protein